MFDKVKDFIFGPEIDDDEDDVVTTEAIIETDDDDSERATLRNRRSAIANSKVVNIHPPTKMEVVRTYPEVVADAFNVCDYVRDNKVCIVNLEGIDSKEAQRIADFLGGVAYAFNGDIQRISKGVFIIAPTSVEITGQLKEELRDNGVIFPWINSVLK